MSLELATKRCTRCGETKPLTEFHRTRKSKDGLNWWCKACALAASQEYQRRRRAEVGDDEWRRLRRAAVAASRERLGMATDRRYNAARNAAISELIERHRAEFDALMERHRYEVESDAGVAS